MKTIRLLSVAAVVAVIAAGTPGQDQPKPTSEHEQLKQMAGTWDAQIKCSFEPGKSPQESKGVFEAKMDLGGFFLVTEFKGEIAGAPFQGRGFTGYDSFKKKYVGVWVDSMNPGIFTSDGAFDKAGKVFTETMEGPDPKGMPMKMRIVTTIKDKDHMQFQMFAHGKDSKESLMMEIAYTRKK